MACSDIIYIKNGVVSVCGVRIGMTRKQAKETLLANGFEAKENQRCVYVDNVIFNKDLPPLNNICFGTDDAYRISHIRLWPNSSDKVIATRFYERYMTIVNGLSLSEDYKDKWLNEYTLAAQFHNSINKVSVVSYLASSNCKGEIDTMRCHTMFYISSAVDKESDAIRVKEQYYKLLDTITTNGNYIEIENKKTKGKNKNILNRIGIALYIVILASYPIYKVFLPPLEAFSSITAFGSSILMFFLYLVGWWFLITPLCWILSTIFWKEGDGLIKDVKKGCAYPILVLMLFLGGCFIYGECKSSSNNNKQGFYSSENSDGGVYICTSLNAKKYHSTPDCRWLENCSGEIKEVSLTVAEKQGKSPCKGCY